MTLRTDEAVPLITLVGPPNSGKTTLFNYLSGQNFKTVNYPGATVEYSISKLQSRFNLKADVVDSPGIVSLVPASPDEKVSIDALFNHPRLGKPDVIIATVDASQLSRHLFLIKQLISSGFRVIVALTMLDLLNKKGYDVSDSALSNELGCEVVKIDGRTGKGIDELVRQADKVLVQSRIAGKPQPVPYNDTSKDKLLSIYKEIEKIENEVIVTLDKAGSGFDLSTANNKLKVLNTAINKRNGRHRPDEFTLKLDRILLNRHTGLIFFFLIMSGLFTSIFWLAEPLMVLVDELFAFLSESVTNVLGYSWYSDLIANGIINGTGSVLVFLPQIIILFLLLGLLEDTGYLSRGAMLIDKPLSKIGLNGKSFVPMLSGFACAIPAMMAARTIPNKRERFLTIFIIPLMSCSARLPVYALLIAFLIPGDKSWVGGIVLASIYIFAVASSVAIAALMNKFNHHLVKERDNSSFILELPAYRMPKPYVILTNTYQSAKLYLQKAGPVILVFSIMLWFLTYFPDYNPQIETAGLDEEEIILLQSSERLANSYAAGLGKLIQPFMEPVGMDWRVGVALIAAFAAREVFVSSMALIFKVTGDEETLQESMLTAMRSAKIGDTKQLLFTPATITGLIIFFIFALQCLSTVAVARKETGGWRIPVIQLFIFTGLAYLMMFITVNGLRALGIP